MQDAIFEPNTTAFQLLYSFYLENSTAEWEKRAQIPSKGITWEAQPYLTDQGALPLNVNIQFITNQVAGNLVLPYATPRQARSQTYPSLIFDDFGHDYCSRYYNDASYNNNGYTALRLYCPKIIPPAVDDQFCRTKYKDSWLGISWRLYRDIRYWNVIAQIWIQDSAANGGTRDMMNITDPPAYGTVLRSPSNSRLQTQLALYE